LPPAKAPAATDVVFHAIREADLNHGGLPPHDQKERESLIESRLELRPAAHGITELREKWERPLAALTIMAGLVLLIACGQRWPRPNPESTRRLTARGHLAEYGQSAGAIAGGLRSTLEQLAIRDEHKGRGSAFHSEKSSPGGREAWFAGGAALHDVVCGDLLLTLERSGQIEWPTARHSN